MLLKKEIAFASDDYEAIHQYCEKTGKSLSEFLIEAAFHEIERLEENNLLQYLINHVPFVSKEEQKEIDELELDFTKVGKEITWDDILS